MVNNLLDTAIDALDRALNIMDTELEMPVTERNKFYTLRRHLKKFKKTIEVS